MSLTIERVPLSGSELCDRYVGSFEEVSRFYSTGSPGALDSYRTVAEAVRADGSGSRWTALAELADSVPEASAGRLRAVIEQRGLFVSTGQQAGLLVSPLFVLFKALTAARLADDLERRLGVPVMPLFSVASEDHDWAEVNHTYILDLDNALVRLQVEAEGLEAEDSPSPSVEHIRLGEDVRDVLEALERVTPDTEFKADLLAPLRAAYRPGRSFAEAFQEALAHTLRHHRFAVVRTADPFVKRHTRELLWSEWRQRDESAARLAERTRSLTEDGFAAQVPVSADATNLFLDGRLGRDRILVSGARARLRRSGEEFGDAELRKIIEETPSRLSPGALLRPVSEAVAFPVVASVVGPSEIAYLAQSHALFDLHGVPAPVIVPRASFRLIEAKVGKLLEKYGVAADELAADTRGVIRRKLEEQAPRELRQALAALRKQVAGALESVEAAAVAFDPGSRSAVGSGKTALFSSIGELESKLQARVREKHGVMEAQLEKAAVNLYPNGRPQERVLNPYHFLVRYGEALLDSIYERAETALD